MKNDILRDIIATVAPTLATALGGPLAGVATRAIAGKLLGREDATIKELEAAVVSGTTGADLVKLKELELEFKIDLENAGIEMESIAADDRDSARMRQVKMKDWTPSVLGLAIILGFFGMLAYIMKYGLLADGNEVTLIMVGALSAMTTQVGNFFFGSSSGSKTKDTLIADLKGAAR